MYGLTAQRQGWRFLDNAACRLSFWMNLAQAGTFSFYIDVDDDAKLYIVSKHRHTPGAHAC